MKKKEELSDERDSILQRAKQIHATNEDHKLYGSRAFVTTTTTTQRRIGPFVLPKMFGIRHKNTAKRNLVPLTSDRTVVMLDDGTIALMNPKDGRYEAFSFATGSSDNFDTIRHVVNSVIVNQRRFLPPQTPR